MRLRGIRFRGLAAARGEQRLDLAGAFCCVETDSAAAARALAGLLRALLQPDAALASLAAWGPGPGARVVAWVDLGHDALRLAVDAPRGRVQLARWEAEAAGFRERSSDLEEIAALFRGGSAADARDFERLHCWAVTPYEAAAEAPHPVPPAVPPEAIAELERELAALRAELEEQGTLVAVAEGIGPRIAAFRAALEARDADRRELEGARRKLLAERAELRRARGRSRMPLGLGLAALAVGILVTWLGERSGLLLAGLGALVAGASLLQLRATQRRLGRLEAVLAGQRIRERTVEQRFDSETEPMRALLAQLELSGVEDLETALAAHEALCKRAAGLERDLAAARAEAALPAPVASQGARAEPETADRDPEALVEAAARSTGLAPAELRARLAAALPLYLNALSRGVLTHARHRPGEGWVLRGPGQPEAVLGELAETLAGEARLAFQLALAERTAAERPLPFLIGPGAALSRDQARALRRLAGFVQVIRVGPPDEDWACHADLRAHVG